MFKKLIGIIFVVLVSTNALAVNDSKNDQNVKFDKKNITQLVSSNTQLSVTSIKASKYKGLVEVMTNGGLFYTSPDGSYLIQGKLYKVGNGITDLTEESLKDVRVTGLKAFEDNSIVFPAKNEKHVVSVFTDITCGYCRRFHNQISEYNDLGITIKYLPYPRSGVYEQSGAFTQGFTDLRSIWCNEDPKTALTNAKAGQSVHHRICDASVESAFNFAQTIGVRGTPNIITENGAIIAGALPPAQLLQQIERLK